MCSGYTMRVSASEICRIDTVWYLSFIYIIYMIGNLQKKGNGCYANFFDSIYHNICGGDGR